MSKIEETAIHIRSVGEGRIGNRPSKIETETISPTGSFFQDRTMNIAKCKKCDRVKTSPDDIDAIDTTGWCMSCLEAQAGICVDDSPTMKTFRVCGIIIIDNIGTKRIETILAIDEDAATQIFRDGYPNCTAVMAEEVEEIED